MSVDDRLAISILHANGTISRWGGDEPNAGDIPRGLKFGTSMPGGFKDCSCSLSRRIDGTYVDLQLFDDIRVYGPGNETVWEGRQQQFPRDHSDSFSINVGAVGWAAHLEDDASFREIYIDRDLTKWHTTPSVQRRISLLSSAYGVRDASVSPDTTTGQPSLATQLADTWTASYRALAEPYYESPVAIGSFYYAWKQDGTLSAADTHWEWQALTSTDDLYSGANTGSGNLRAAGPGTGTVAGGSNRRIAMVQFDYNTAGGTAGATYTVYWTVLAVYGNHGLTKQGTASATNAQGFYASDVIANIVSRAAPKLTYTTGASGTIQPTTFVIPQLAFLDPTTASDAIQLVNGYHLYDWAVWEKKTFYWYPPSATTGTVWEARLSDGDQVSLEGDNASDLVNGVIVSFTDPLGNKKTVGPTGSGADFTNSVLSDASVTNPVNVAGLRKWAKIDLSVVTDSFGATQLGYVWLQEHLLPQKRGQIVLSGTVTHSDLGERPVWAVRAGDFIRIADFPADEPRKIIETSYDHDSRKNTLSIGTTPFKLEAIIERVVIQQFGSL